VSGFPAKRGHQWSRPLLIQLRQFGDNSKGEYTCKPLSVTAKVSVRFPAKAISAVLLAE